MGRLFSTLWRGFTGLLSLGYLIFILNPIQMASILLYPFSRKALRRINRWCARSIWGLWVLMAERQNKIKVRFTGDPIPFRENALVLPNHQTMADVLLLMSFSWRAGRVGDMKWFVKDILKYIPGPGWGMYFLDCIFVKRDWTKDKQHIQNLFSKYIEDDLPIFLISFPEGTRINAANLKRAQAFAKEKGLPVPEHTLIPRVKGFLASLEGLGDHLDAVYDLTLGYPEGRPTLTECFLAKVSHLEIHVKRYALSDLPEDAEGRSKWLQTIYQEKEQLMATLEKEGRFPGEEQGFEVLWEDYFKDEAEVGKSQALSTSR